MRLTIPVELLLIVSIAIAHVAIVLHCGNIVNQTECNLVTTRQSLLSRHWLAILVELSIVQTKLIYVGGMPVLMSCVVE